MKRRDIIRRSAVSIQAREDVPHLFQEQFRNLVKDDEPFPRTALLYPEKSASGRTNATLVFAHAGGVAVCERGKSATRVRSFSYGDIHGVEWGMILLFSWFTISGTINGAPVQATVEFNTVDERHFLPILETIRRRINRLEPGGDGSQLQRESAKFDDLALTNYKYMSFGKKSLLAGETVRRFVYQPRILSRILKIFPYLLTPAHMAILTDKEMILIRDERNINYGGVWNFLPLGKISGMSTEPDPKTGMTSFYLRTVGGRSFVSVFEPSRQGELELLTAATG
jgi:hypothetical protein